MSVIAELTGHSEDARNLTAYAHDYIDRWQSLGIAHSAAQPHTTLSYGSDDSHGLSTPQRLDVPSVDGL
jgi:hypothetical protein